MRIICVAAVLMISACGSGSAPPLVASEVIVTAPPPGMAMSAAYMSLTNNSDQTINITRVASEHYESVRLHETTIEDGISRMRALPELEILAGETAILEPGGKHLMLTRPTSNGDTVTLQFFEGDDLILSIDAGFERRDD